MLIGVKSSALALGRADAAVPLYLLRGRGRAVGRGRRRGRPRCGFLGRARPRALQLFWQAARVDIDDPADCLAKFRSNRWSAGCCSPASSPRMSSERPWTRRLSFARNTAIAAPPLVPEIRLHLATEVTPLWHATEATLARGACRRRTGPSPGPAARRSRAICSIIPQTVAGKQRARFRRRLGPRRHRRRESRRRARRRRRDRPFRRRRDRRSTPRSTMSPSR